MVLWKRVSLLADPVHLRQRVESVSCAVITVSDTRTIESDKSGSLIKSKLLDAGHVLHSSSILRDEPGPLREHVALLCKDDTCGAIITTGGTGFARRDTTIEAIDALLDKRIEGFGELFRVLSFEQVGAASMLSRALGGVCGSTVIFCLPGSPAAVELALDRLILPQLGHLLALIEDR